MGAAENWWLLFLWKIYFENTFIFLKTTLINGIIVGIRQKIHKKGEIGFG